MNSLTSLALGVAVLLPMVVAAGLWRFLRRQHRVLRAFGSRTPHPRWLRPALAMAAALALAAALVDPRWGAPRAGAEGRSGPVVLVLDVSSSMLAEDVPSGRLELLRSAARRLVSTLPGTPVGIVVFAGRAYALSPPTIDPSALELYLSSLDPQMVTQTGSALAPAVRQGVALLGGPKGKGGSLVVVSDGDAREEEDAVRAAARLARQAGVAVHAVGVGTTRGAPVPDIDYRTGRRVGFKLDPSGRTALSRRRDDLLRALARSTGGSYLALDRPAGVDAVVAQIRSAPGGMAGGGREVPARYAWFAGAALLLLVGEALVGRRAAMGVA